MRKCIVSLTGRLPIVPGQRWQISVRCPEQYRWHAMLLYVLAVFPFLIIFVLHNRLPHHAFSQLAYNIFGNVIPAHNRALLYLYRKPSFKHITAENDPLLFRKAKRQRAAMAPHVRSAACFSVTAGHADESAWAFRVQGV